MGILSYFSVKCDFMEFIFDTMLFLRAAAVSSPDCLRPQYVLSWNTAAIFGLVLQLVICPCLTVYSDVLPSIGHALASSLEPISLRRSVASLGLFYTYYMVGAPKDFHWLFHLTVPLAAPHVSLLIHKPKAPSGTHAVSSHVLPYFGIHHYLYLASLPLITCLNSNATSIVIFLLFDFLFPFLLALTLSGLLRPCDWQLSIKKEDVIEIAFL